MKAFFFNKKEDKRRHEFLVDLGGEGRETPMYCKHLLDGLGLFEDAKGIEYSCTYPQFKTLSLSSCMEIKTYTGILDDNIITLYDVALTYGRFKKIRKRKVKYR